MMVGNNKPAEFDQADFEFAVLVNMLNQLPEKVREPFLEQAAKARNAQLVAHSALFKLLSESLGDVRLGLLAQQFDLDATKRELQQLRDELDD